MSTESTAPDAPETVQELGPGMTGRWLVTTGGSQHVWDLNTLTSAGAWVHPTRYSQEAP